MEIDKIIMGIVLTTSPILCVILACAGVYGSVGEDEVMVGVYATVFYWGFLIVATVLLRYAEIKEGVRDGNQSR